MKHLNSKAVSEKRQTMYDTLLFRGLGRMFTSLGESPYNESDEEILKFLNDASISINAEAARLRNTMHDNVMNAVNTFQRGRRVKQ